MLAVIDHGLGGDLARRVSALYEFVFRSLVKAGYRHDEESLGDAIRILEIERETWRQVCDKLATNAPQATFHDVGAAGGLPSTLGAGRGVPPPGHHVPMVDNDPDLLSQSGGFSIEA